MKYIIDPRADQLHVAMEGAFTFSDMKNFRRLLSLIWEQREHSRICLDVSGLEFIDATALGLLMMIHDVAKLLHLDLVFEGPQGQVSRQLQEAARYNALTIAA